MLTTPQIKKNDDIFPGENIFLYWKSSASLWESKLQSSAVGGQVYVPINWAIHSPNPDQYDFGDIKPETDLSKLQQIAQNLGIRLTFLINLGPIPFVINSGIPSFLAKTPSLNKDGTQLFTFDRTDKLNHIFSFYNPRVFQYFSKFLKVLNKYFIAKAISSEVIITEYFYYENDKAHSFLEDYSSDYIAGFHKYLNQIEDENPQKFEQIKLNKKLEQKAESDYQDLIKSLYLEAISGHMGTNLLGVRNFLVLGASLTNSIERSIPTWDERNNFFESFFFSLYNNFVPVSCLLSEDEKGECLTEALKNIVTKDFVEEGIAEDSLEESLGFRMMNLFNIFSNSDNFANLGLSSLFENEYKWTYKINPMIQTEFDENVYIFCQKEMSDNEFNYALKIFMNGGVSFLDEDSLSLDQQRKLTIFLTENSIESQSVRLGVIVKNSNLGQGNLFRFRSSELSAISSSKKLEFWSKILSTINLKHPICESDRELFFTWLKRYSNSYELDYEEIRRVSIYNPTDYKKNIKIKGHRNLSFLKSIDERSVVLNSTNKSLDIQLHPKGSVSIDFGLFE